MHRSNKIVLERMEFPEPVISVAVEPKSQADQEKMGIALGKLAQEDPSFRVETDEETGQTIISGMGELHLDILVDRMKREFSVEANIGKPQVAYREKIRKSVDANHKFATSVRWSWSVWSRCHRVQPFRKRRDWSLSMRLLAVRFRKNTSLQLRKGIQEQMKNGVIAGYPI